MKVNLLICFVLAAWCGNLATLRAQSTNAVPSVRAQLQSLMDQVQTKFHDGKRSEADFADEFKILDGLIASNRGTNDIQAAEVTYMKAMLFLEVLRDRDRGVDVMRQIITNYPNTPYGQNAVTVVAKLTAPSAPSVPSATTPASPPSPELLQLIKQIQDKITAGNSTEAQYAVELKALDNFIGGYQGTNTQDTAIAAFNKGLLYVLVFTDYDRGEAQLKQVQTHFPGTQYAQDASGLLGQLAQLKLQQEAMKQQADRFPVGKTFDDFAEKDLNGKPISIAGLKGKLVILDFWATWCPPCVAELPNLIATYQKHHADGLEVISISSDEDRPQLTAFIKQHPGMDWPQYFDGQGTDNKLAVQYGVRLIPFMVLIGRDGKVIATDLRGPKIESAVAAALAAK